MNLKKYPWWYISFVMVVLACWTSWMFIHDTFNILSDNIRVIITMIFGSFIAGSSPEGSASVAYPVFTLYLGITPDVARNFAFAIQSIGMTSASIFILNKKIPLDWNYISYVSFGGLFGLLAGTYYIVPFVQPAFAKLIFVSLWLSFGIILYFQNRNKHRTIFERIENFSSADMVKLVVFGFVGGGISSLFGTGINIFTFCFLVIYYKVNEKVATPSSIIIMTIETLAGFALHGLILQDINSQSYEMWISCIPFVIFFAPLGAYLVNRISRVTFNNFLYFIFLLQYVGAMIVIRPDFNKAIISLAIVASGMLIFRFIGSLKKI